MSPEYIAGLFDGEGYFTIRRVKSTCSNVRSAHEYRFQGYAHISMREGWLLDRVTETLGYGTVNHNYKAATARHAAYACMTIQGASLTRFCEEIGPLLEIKSEQARAMLSLRRSKERRGNRNLSDDDYLLEVGIWEEMRDLNLKGPEKKNSRPVRPIVPACVKAWEASR